MRIEEIAVDDDVKSEGLKSNREVGLVETFCSDNYRNASWVGVTLSAFQQLTGINAIIFYSAVIFSET